MKQRRRVLWTLRETRAAMLKSARSTPYLRTRKSIAELDAASPGWKRCAMHVVEVRHRDGHIDLDVVHELPGRVFLRGWDMTGAIHRRAAEATP